MVTGYGGTYRALVVDNVDPLQENRLAVVVPDVDGDDVPVWAAASTSAAGWSTPSVGDTVWISFERGDTDHPVWQSDDGGDHAARGFVGTYRGVVVDNIDPMQENRLAVIVPDVDPSSTWATPSADTQCTTAPEVGAEVWVEYEGGDPAYPRWVGLV